MSDHDQNISNDQPLIPPSAPKAPGARHRSRNSGVPGDVNSLANSTRRCYRRSSFCHRWFLNALGNAEQPYSDRSASNGTEGDGIITLIGGVITGILVLTKKYLASVVVSAITAAVLVYDFFNVSNIVDSGGLPSPQRQLLDTACCHGKKLT